MRMVVWRRPVPGMVVLVRAVLAAVLVLVRMGVGSVAMVMAVLVVMGMTVVVGVFVAVHFTVMGVVVLMGVVVFMVVFVLMRVFAFHCVVFLSCNSYRCFPLISCPVFLLSIVIPGASSRAFEIAVDLKQPFRKTWVFHTMIDLDVGLDIDQGAPVHRLQTFYAKDAAFP